MKKILILCTTDSMIWNFLIPHIKKLQLQNIEIECACSKTGFYFREIQELTGCVIHEIPFKRSPYNLSNLKSYFILNKLIKKKKYDLIFCHEPVGGAMGRLVGHSNRCKVIYMAHGFHFYKGAPFKNTMYYIAERILSRYTDTLITINQEDYSKALKFKAKSIKKINGIGINTCKFKKKNSCFLRSQYGLHTDDLIILSVGELIPRKNHKVILRALHSLRDDKIHYFIAGDGELKEYLSKQIRVLGLENQVHLLGFCRNVSDLYNSCDVFVLPSRQEGLSVALMEAMACAKPAIVSKIRGNIDLIDSKQGGFIVDIDDIENYARAIRKIKNNPDLCIRFGEYNMNKVKKFDINNVEKQLNDIYQKMLGEN
ncbi:TPA: glycosyltransferase family 4 protein [Enterococcus faecium]|uniref:glycosyltransferase family 4 protein n=1 Tax=Enterococcus faecium TaxID=1352 RepID=UPI00280D32E8|nr:glycosyltransferase family 4 protein [Enterococcus faecium]